MKILIVDTYYPAFLRSVHAREPGLDRRSYAEQWRVLMDQCFGTADFYSRNLAGLGHEAVEVVANARALQMAWAGERGLALGYRLSRRGPRGIPMPWVSRDWLYPVLRAQIMEYRPDILHIQDPEVTDPAFVREIRPHVRRVVAQIASVYSPGTDFGVYDLVVSSLPHLVDKLRKAGSRAELFGLGFEPRVLERLRPGPRHDVVFVGGVTPAHWRRVRLLEAVAQHRPIAWWGYGAERLPRRSALRACHRGMAWGTDMYNHLRGSRIALNYHLFEEPYANNMRLYEATGVGTLLLTDWKENLSSLFEPEREVATYRSAEECIEKIDGYLSRESERADVARAGQARTLRDHTYERRMSEYLSLIRPLL